MNLFDLLPFLVTLSLILVDPALGAKSTATSFCKCICFNNSTIIALNPPPSSTSASAIHNLAARSPHALAAEGTGTGSTDNEPAAAAPSRPHHKLTCADCTRAFCLDYNLPICKNARDEDVFTTCFQRDSLKDETVVVIFVFATAGLLAWAVVKPWIDRLREKNTFAPLLQHDRGGRGGRPQYTSSTARGQNAQRTSRGGILGASPVVGFGDDRPGGEEDEHGRGSGSGSGSRSGNGNANGKASSRRGEGGQIPAGVRLPYDEDMHADQDAMDIVSDMPSGPSGPRSGSRS